MLRFIYSTLEIDGPNWERRHIRVDCVPVAQVGKDALVYSISSHLGLAIPVDNDALFCIL